VSLSDNIQRGVLRDKMKVTRGSSSTLEEEEEVFMLMCCMPSVRREEGRTDLKIMIQAHWKD
jgi:hypothetical protein